MTGGQPACRPRWCTIARAMARRFAGPRSLPSATSGGSTAREIANAYLLILGREAEPEALSTKTAQLLRDALVILLGSDEFAERIARPIVSGRPPLVERPIVSHALLDWTAAALPLSRSGHRQLRLARTWVELADTVFSDPIFLAYLSKADRPWGDHGFLAALRRQARCSSRRIIGRVDDVDEIRVTGWAIDLNDPARLLSLEAYADGVLAGQGRASAMRADVREIYAVSGLCGFTIDLSAAGLCAGDAPFCIEVREVTTGQLIGEGEARGGTRYQDRQATTFPLEAYSTYYDRVYRVLRQNPISVADRYGFGIVALIPEGGGLLDKMLTSIAGQTRDDWELTVIGGPSCAHDQQSADSVAETDRQRVRLMATDPTMPIDRQANAAVAATAGEFLLIAGEVLFAPHALAEIAAALTTHPTAKLVYWDEDEIVWPNGKRHRHSPRLKNPFDPIWLVQQNYIGNCFLIARSLFEEIGGFRNGVGNVDHHDFLLRATDRCGREAVHHIEHVLHGRLTQSGPYPASLAAAAEHLRQAGWPAVAVPETHAAGADLPDTLRIQPTLGGINAMVIIASRDKPELLGPCIASLLATRAASHAEFAITVVDHASVTPAALVLFRRLRAEGVTVRRYAGEFNWAAINNQGAAGQTADVLVFLNDDTLTFAPGWCDELCLHAMRPDVGAVGTRLLYPDGSVQHAGMLVHGNGVTPHEGLGMTKDDRGYLDRLIVARDVSAVTGACLATRRAVFEALGGFDADRFPVTFNDVDYCARVREAGLSVRYTPHAGVYHLESKSRGFDVTPERRARHERERRAFVAKWPHLPMRDPFYNAHFDRDAAPHRRLVAPWATSGQEDMGRPDVRRMD